MMKIGRDRFTAIFEKAGAARRAEYLHWDKLRHLDPPEGLSHEEWWVGTKLSRAALVKRLPLTDPNGVPATFAVPDVVQRLLHSTDQRASGEIAMPEVVTADEQARQHYLVNSLMEEAIRSSQLEGATTSRRVAKELLQTGREPRTRSERMILNTYRAQQYVREYLGDQLMPEDVLEMQRILTGGTVDIPESAGRLQAPGEERVAVYDQTTGEVIHRPPPAEQLPERLERLCEFANAHDDDVFVHPVVRSILLHFWLAYDHPFEDGNGRTARLLFYWSMRKHGYWLTEYLSISKILREGPSKYARAFLLTETDGLDTTYFVVFQLEVIERAIRQLHEYLARKVKELQTVQRALRGDDRFNHRQLALLNHALQHPEHEYTFQSHATSHNVTHETARTDLLQLWRRELLTRRRAGRRHVFHAQADLNTRLSA
jgi:Fic family protein